MKIQHKLDSNITMCLDECVKLPAAYETVKKIGGNVHALGQTKQRRLD